MKDIVLSRLDLLLTFMVTQPHGIQLSASQLLQSVNLPLTHENLFLVTILISDDNLTKINTPSQTPVVSLSANGFKFYHSGGYVLFYKNSLNDLVQNQEKMKLEIVNLKYGFVVSIISLIVSLVALIISFFV